MWRNRKFDIRERGCLLRLTEGLSGLRAGIDSGEDECELIRLFFDGIFGEGEGEKLCGSEYNYEVHLMRYMEFIFFVNSQIDSFTSLCAGILTACEKKREGGCA